MLELLLAMSLVRLKADTTSPTVVSGFSQTAQSHEVITDIRIQGNVLTTDDEMRQLTGVAVGAPFTADLPAAIEARLKATKKFVSVEVLKRYASIDDPSKIILMIIVNEGPVKIESLDFPGADGPPDTSRPLSRVVRRRGLGMLWLPLLSFEDGYGFSYGVQLARTDVAGPNSRLSFPLTWGGERHAGAELEKLFPQGPLTRVEAGAAILQRTNPFFGQDDRRDHVWARAERTLGSPLRVGAGAGWQHVTFMDATDRFTHVGADVTVDTRLDPFLARNAVYGRAAIERLDFERSASAVRTELDGQAYAGLYRQNILVLRALRQDSNVPLPPYLQPMLGGMSNLRGLPAGSAIGDTLVAGSAELRVPLTSPLKIAKAGVNAFVDIGTVYAKGQQLADQHFARGIGGGVWLAANIVHLNLIVAHGEMTGRSDTRAHFSMSIGF